ncbi:type 4a pilus biogenesis protein PilO [Candidatus Vondammii sp. HM_W22]|uniref:type 4a pilus biogenesis protein PilO n=1 Tax=Candidatus Vondammii sp. HM_W22 TaxID=2687299 RepID=UPI001F13058A|nr:type 4a pilus biogenesis protein PilO [Candidatus Vondammii sp. HM_W22]
MKLEELNELDFSNIGNWPDAVKAFLVLVLCVGLGIGWYYYDTEEQLLGLEKAERKEQDLREEFKRKQVKAVNLEKYKEQLEEMRASFGAMLRQLPDKTEVGELLIDVSQTGLGAGLEFELFDPQDEVQREFYAELPIKIRVEGGYHEFGKFVSGLAALSRIVTLHNVTVTKQFKKDDGASNLVLETTAKTYRYIDEETGK